METAIQKTPDTLSVVTAYFDIGRKKWNNSARTNDFYINCFKFWARIQNDLTIYTTPSLSNKIRQVREELGLGDRTHIVTINDFRDIDRPLYERLEKVMSSPIFRKFRGNSDGPSSRPEYNYIVFLKPYFVMDAISKGLTSNPNIAWMDFGYNKCGTFYLKPEEFNFLWKYPLKNKIHIFSENDPDDRPVFEIVRTFKIYLANGIIAAPSDLWESVYDLFKESMENLLACGMADNDQMLLYMAYQKRPELFEIHRIYHLLESLKRFGGEHLTVMKLKKHRRIKRDARENWKNGEYEKAIRGYLSYVTTKMRRKME